MLFQDEALRVALAAVERASAVCGLVQGELADLRAITKDDKSPVTVADFASQAVIGRALRESFGGDVVLVAEEDSAFLRESEHAAHLAACVDAVRRARWNGEPVWADVDAESLLAAVDVGDGEPGALADTRGGWCLDPIDGTKGFLRGQQYCVSLGYLQDGVVQLGVLGCPNLTPDAEGDVTVADAGGSVFWAVRGEGARARALVGGEDEKIVRGDSGFERGVRMTESVEQAHSDQSASMRLAAGIAKERGVQLAEPARLDSQCKYAVVARGQADAYVRLPTRAGYVERIWDHAAGSVVLEESGCVVSDVFGKPLDFSRGKGLEENMGVVGAPAELHGAIIAALAAQRSEG